MATTMWSVAQAFFLALLLEPRWCIGELALRSADRRGTDEEAAEEEDGDGEGDSSGLLSMLAQLPEPKVPMMSLARRNRPKETQRFRAAVCMTGHIRTFAMPGVYTSIAKNLVQSLNGGEVDLYFIGHLGTMKHGHTSKKDFSAPELEDDAALQEALKYPGLNVKHTEITKGGSCEELQLSYKQDNISRHCGWAVGGMQFSWIDRCIERVMSADKPYDLVIKTRPDIGVFAPIPWNKISKTKVNFLLRPYGSGDDFFFTIPASILDLYWSRVREQYITNWVKFSPDRVIFPHAKDNSTTAMGFKSLMEPLQFPVAIVRNGSHAECGRLQTQPYKKPCLNYTAEGNWQRSSEAPGSEMPVVPALAAKVVVRKEVAPKAEATGTSGSRYVVNWRNPVVNQRRPVRLRRQ